MIKFKTWPKIRENKWTFSSSIFAWKGIFWYKNAYVGNKGFPLTLMLGILFCQCLGKKKKGFYVAYGFFFFLFFNHILKKKLKLYFYLWTEKILKSLALLKHWSLSSSGAKQTCIIYESRQSQNIISKTAITEDYKQNGFRVERE